jgi:hypothetical protein
VPAHHGAAEHAWKDGDSGRRGRRHAAIVDMLTHDGLGHSEDGGGVLATRDAALRAIMEDATRRAPLLVAVRDALRGNTCLSPISINTIRLWVRS